MVSKIFLKVSLILSLSTFIMCTDDSTNDTKGDDPKNGTETKAIVLKPKTHNKGRSKMFNINSSPFKYSDYKSFNEQNIYKNGDIEITVPANAVKLNNGETPKGRYRIAVREFLSLGAMLKAGLTTRSGDKLLTTGGSFYWEIQDGNGNTNYKVDNASLNFKMNKLYSDKYAKSMKLFSANYSADTGINWINPKQTKTGQCTDTADTNCQQLMGSISTGFVNIDDFLELGDNPVNIKVKVLAQNDYNISSCFAFVKNDNPHLVTDLIAGEEYFSLGGNYIPSGLTVKLIAIAQNDEGQKYLKIKTVTLQTDNGVFELLLEPSTTEAINDAFDN